MKTIKALGLTSLVAASALMSAQTLARPDARSLYEVDAMSVDSNSCNGALRDSLQDNGFLVTNRRSADAELDVDVRHLDADFGASARYTATVRGDDGDVLFRTSGREDSITTAELCEDISEDIVERIENRVG